MKIKLLTAILFLSSLQTFPQSPHWLWGKGIGGTGADVVYSIAVDDSGNVYSTGFFNGIVDFDPGIGISYLASVGGAAAIFISKLDGSGNFVWAKAMGGISGDIGKSIALDNSGNVYTTGYFSDTVDFDPGAGVFTLVSAGGPGVFVLKLDTSGNFVWAKAITGTGVSARSISIDQSGSGDVYITGGFVGIVDFDPGAGVFNLNSVGVTTDIFISKLDSSGNFVWAKAMGGTGFDEGRSITLDASGNVYTTGGFAGTVDFDPGAGVFNLTGGGGFISKLDASGNFVWANTIIGDGFSIALDASTNVYTIGSGVISKLDSSGNFVWVKVTGGISCSIALDASANVYTTGYFDATTDFDPGAGVFNLSSLGGDDIFISKLDSSGNFIWAKAAGGTDSEESLSIANDALSNLYVAGYFFSPSIIFNSDTVSGTNGTADIFIAKLSCSTSIIINPIACDSYTSPSGNYIWTTSGTYLEILPGSAGCDSIITINLTINTVDTSVTQNDVILTANTFGATYQWLDCDSGFAPVSGDTNQVFTPSVDGNYAVAITQNGCTDTSSCYIVTGVGITEISFVNNLSIFPNPAKSELRFESSRFKLQSADVYDLVGEKIIHYSLKKENSALLDIRLLPAGIYFLIITTENNAITKKLIIQK